MKVTDESITKYMNSSLLSVFYKKDYKQIVLSLKGVWRRIECVRERDRERKKRASIVLQKYIFVRRFPLPPKMA